MAERLDEVKKLFTSKSARVETNKGEAYYQQLFDTCRARLDYLREQPAFNRLDFTEILSDEGLDRRDFMKWVSAA